jgi:hypothetical protein
LPDAKNYTPQIKESSLNSSEVSLTVNTRRKEVFKGRQFAFASKKQMQKYQDAISYGGGSVVLLVSDAENNVDPEVFSDPRYLAQLNAKYESNIQIFFTPRSIPKSLRNVK